MKIETKSEKLNKTLKIWKNTGKFEGIVKNLKEYWKIEKQYWKFEKNAGKLKKKNRQKFEKKNERSENKIIKNWTKLWNIEKIVKMWKNILWSWSNISETF